MRGNVLLPFICCAALLYPGTLALAGEARQRWELMNQIRLDKFDLVLPEAMRENGIDMWITVNREGLDDPLTDDLGRGYVGDWGYYVFTDRGDRLERALLGVGTRLVEANGAYDIMSADADLAGFVAERDPGTIALNFAEHIGAAEEALRRALRDALAGCDVVQDELAAIRCEDAPVDCPDDTGPR